MVRRVTSGASGAGFDSQTDRPATIAPAAAAHATTTATAKRARRAVRSCVTAAARCSGAGGDGSFNTNVATDASAMRRERSLSRHRFTSVTIDGDSCEGNLLQSGSDLSTDATRSLTVSPATAAFR